MTYLSVFRLFFLLIPFSASVAFDDSILDGMNIREQEEFLKLMTIIEKLEDSDQVRLEEELADEGKFDLDPLKIEEINALSLQREKDLMNPILLHEMETHNYSLEQTLKDEHWLSEDTVLVSKPSSLISGEVVSYYGNVPSTTLYKQGKIAFLPAAPVIYTYNPIINFGYIDAAYSLTPTDQIKSFFGKSEIVNCFLVLQKIINDSTPQLLRLHGFIHGVDAGAVNASLDVSVELINHDTPLLFTPSTPTQSGSVHCHGGMASPNNFALLGFDDKTYTYEPFWQSLGIYLPETKTAALIIMGQNILDYWFSEIEGVPILVPEFKLYLENLLGNANIA